MTFWASGMRFWVALALLVFAVLAVRVVVIAGTSKDHPDEALAPGLLRQLDTSSDTNWKHADVPAGFRAGDQYNFSGYYIALHAFARAVEALPSRILPKDPMRTLRLFSALCAAAVLVVVAVIAREEAGDGAAVFAALLVALSPGLVMDGFYARPDSFGTLLALLLLFVYLRRGRMARGWVVIAGLLLGYLVSIKVSFALFALLLAPAARSPKGALLAVIATLMGFAAGAPGALAHPAEYWNGIQTLRNQYTTGFPPHGLGADSSIVERGLYGGEWLAQTWGLAILAAVAGVVSLLREKRRDFLFALLPFALLLAYFMTTPVFFERNLAPGIAALAIVAGIGIAAMGRRWSKWLAIGAGAAALAVPAIVSAKILQAMYEPFDIRGALMATLAEYHRDVLVVGWSRPPWDSIRVGDTPCDPPIVQVHHAGDRRTREWLEQGRARGWVEVKRLPSRFEGYVPSTFHTYLSTEVSWLAKGVPSREERHQSAGECAVRWE